MEMERYSRQMVFYKLGEAGQRKLLESRVAIIGLGALGTVIANNLCRSGIGFIRLIDRDYVELSNLQRQSLYNEQDAAEQTPKAIAAYNHLSKVNSEIILEPVLADVNSSNIENLIKDVHLVLDGSDNLEIRHLINEACHKLKIPWVYGGVLGSYGMTMNIMYGDRPCFRCLQPNIQSPGAHLTCSTAGVLNMITGVIASIESVEAIKILIDSPEISKMLSVFDVWHNTVDHVTIDKKPSCPVCGQSNYEFLGKLRGSYATSLCGRDSIQIVPSMPASFDFERLAERLKTIGTVKYNRYMLSFDDGIHRFKLFPDGRAIIMNAKDESAAKSVYSEYIGF